MSTQRELHDDTERNEIPELEPQLDAADAASITGGETLATMLTSIMEMSYERLKGVVNNLRA